MEMSLCYGGLYRIRRFNRNQYGWFPARYMGSETSGDGWGRYKFEITGGKQEALIGMTVVMTFEDLDFKVERVG